MDKLYGILKKPLRVYKVGILANFNTFLRLYVLEINPEFKSLPNPVWRCNHFNIYEGYHSYLTKEIAKLRSKEYNNIGIFEIPVGATIYVNYRSREVISTDIKYLGLLE